jgi:alkane 1-monooxygenase
MQHVARRPFFFVFLIPALVVGGILVGSWASAAAIVFVFVAVPLLDRWLGRESRNPLTADHDARFDRPLLLWVPVQLATMLWWAARAADAPLDAELVLSTVSIGLMSGGIGITIAHELMHRASRAHRALAEVLMGSVTYTHFCIEHVHGHHRHVATPRDPASSRLGESVYRFLPRTIVGGLRSAWSIEAERMRKAQRPVLSAGNRMVRYFAVAALGYVALATWLGGQAALLWAAQSAVAIGLLEVINYVEHYGLSRREVAPGKYERVMPHHSWNSDFRVTNWLLFNLQRHSDHHFMASRPYDLLRHYDDVPQLPAGYATMLIVALVPPVWRRVMDPRVHAVTQAQQATARAA